MDKNSLSFAQYTHIYTTSETMTIQPDMHANKTTVHDTMRQIRSMATNTDSSVRVCHKEEKLFLRLIIFNAAPSPSGAEASYLHTYRAL